MYGSTSHGVCWFHFCFRWCIFWGVCSLANHQYKDGDVQAKGSFAPSLWGYLSTMICLPWEDLLIKLECLRMSRGQLFLKNTIDHLEEKQHICSTMFRKESNQHIPKQHMYMENFQWHHLVMLWTLGGVSYPQSRSIWHDLFHGGWWNSISNLHIQVIPGLYVYKYLYIYCIYTVFIFFIGLAKKATLWGGELQPSAYKGDIYLKTLRFDSEILQKKTTT